MQDKLLFRGIATALVTPFDSFSTEAYTETAGPALDIKNGSIKVESSDSFGICESEVSRVESATAEAEEEQLWNLF